MPAARSTAHAHAASILSPPSPWVIPRFPWLRGNTAEREKRWMLRGGGKAAAAGENGDGSGIWNPLESGWNSKSPPAGGLSAVGSALIPVFASDAPMRVREQQQGKKLRR